MFTNHLFGYAPACEEEEGSRRIKIPSNLLEGIQALAEVEKEIGGGFVVDKETNTIKEILIFYSDDKYSVIVDNQQDYDIGFHSHPTKIGCYQRIPSVADIATVMEHEKEEIIFTKGYIFIVSIENKCLLDASLQIIEDQVKSRILKDKYDIYNAYFRRIFDAIKAESRKLNIKYDKDKFIKRKWKSALTDFGLSFSRLDIELAIVNIFT